MLFKQSRLAFTLIEVALSLAVLVTGLTAIISIYMVSLQWVEEIRIDLTALQTGRIALADAGVLMDKDNNRLGQKNTDTTSKGWINDYYIVRSVETPSYPNFPGSAGKYLRVTIQVYYGGTEEDGLLAHEFSVDQIMPKEYN